MMDVLVVGAGPTGLALAATLAAHGIRPRVIDRAHDRVHESRALAIQPRTLEVLSPLGVTPELVAAGRTGVRLRLHAGRREFAIPLFDLGLSDTAYPFLLFVSQSQTERILGEHLARAGIVVERGVELVGLTEEAATLRHDDGREERVSAAYVAGCDGAHSTVRGAAGIAFGGGSYPQTFVLADAEAEGIEPDAAHAFLAGRGLVFFFPLGSPATWRLLAMRPSPTGPGEEVTLAGVQALVDEYTGHRVRLHDPVWMTNFRLHHRAADRYRAGRVFLAGDAAHIHSPVGAQGMNTGIQDAVNLGWKLAAVLRGRGPAALLDTYEVERAPVGAEVVRFTDRAFRLATSDAAWVRFARERVAPRLVPVGVRWRGARSYVFRTMSQLSIRYRSSPLSVNADDPKRHGLRAGDRFPDGEVVHNGVSTTWHALIAAPGWHLLHPAAGAPGTDLSDIHVHSGLPLDAQYLIRPDGHIGLRCASQDHAALTRYLRDWRRAGHDDRR